MEIAIKHNYLGKKIHLKTIVGENNLLVFTTTISK
jgi:hypothetical protein